MVGYSKAATNRGRGFAIQASAAVLLWLGATAAIVWRLVHA
jgi:glutathione S-transferase